MDYEPVQRWADNAAYAAGRALNQGKDFFHSARDKALEAAKRGEVASQREIKRARSYFPTLRDKAVDAAKRGESIRQREFKRARSYLPTLHDKWDSFLESASDQFSRAGSTLHNRFHSTEHTLLKVGAVFLMYKLFSNRHQPVSDIANDTRKHVEAKPIKSAILALGIGYALGKILR